MQTAHDPPNLPSFPATCKKKQRYFGYFINGWGVGLLI